MMALPGTTLLSSVVIATVVRGGVRLASKRGWLPRAYYQRQVLSSLKDKDIEKALRHFERLRSRGSDHDRVEVVADLLRMHLDSGIRFHRAKLAEVRRAQIDLSRQVDQLSSERGDVTAAWKALQFAPSVLAVLLGGMLAAFVFTTGLSAAARVAAIFGGLFLLAQAGLNLRRYRRWLKKQRWLVQSRALQIQECQRRLPELADAEKELVKKIAELKLYSSEVRPTAVGLSGRDPNGSEDDDQDSG